MRRLNATHLVYLVIGALTGCAAAPPAAYDYSAFREADPRSILVVPPVNNAVEVDAQAFYLATISRPVGERGYYVFPIGMVKGLLEEEGLADANLVHEGDPRILAEMFGADAVLYVTIQRWDARYMVFSTSVTVQFDYLLRDGRTGDELWSASVTRVYSSDDSSAGGVGGLITNAIAAAVERASPRYVPLAREANYQATTQAHKGVPAGKYHPRYGQDGDLY